jgi:DNA mismatch repair protein MSH5
MEIEISYELAQQVLKHEETLVAVSDLCGELDFMIALSQGANQYKLVRPRMTEENIIDLKDCRHLLQEMTVPSYVANDAYLVGGKGPNHDHHQPHSRSNTPDSHAHTDSSNNPSTPTMLLLTGPNYSGKSIYLKSIALSIYLSHLGSFVPCTSATIGLTDSILTRLRTCETVSRSHSAFMLDLQQVALMLRSCTHRSLLVIDEFGKGTDATDGAGLACGVLKHLLGRGDGAPKVLAATHFHEIFEQGFLTDEVPGLAFEHMEVRVDDRRQTDHSEERASTTDTDGTDNAQITYLYNLCPGRSAESFGTQCAAMNGVPAAIVQRASQLSRLAAQGADLVSVCAGVGKEEEEDLVEAEDIARGFLGWDLDGPAEEAEDAGADDVRGLLEGLLAQSSTVEMESRTVEEEETGMETES